MNDYVIGHIRTIVPMLVGAALTWLGNQLGIVDLAALAPELSTGLVGVVSAIYYALVRLLAERWGWIGILLGYNKAPAYEASA